MPNEGCATWAHPVVQVGFNAVQFTSAAKWKGNDGVIFGGSFAAPTTFWSGQTLSSPATGFVGTANQFGKILSIDPITGVGLGSVTVDLQDGNSAPYFVAATATDAVDFGAGPLPPFPGNSGRDVVVARFDPPKTQTWAKRFKGGGALTTIVDAWPYLVARVDGPLEFGASAPAPIGKIDILVGGLDASGNPSWSRRFGAPGTSMNVRGVSMGKDFLMAVDSGAASVDYGGGPISGEGIVALGFQGAHVWSHRWTPLSQTGFNAGGLAADASGGFYVGGLSWGTSDLGGGPLSSPSGTGLVLAKFDADGNHVWGKIFDGMGYPQKAVVTPTGDVIIGGEIESAVDFGGGPLPVSSGQSVFIAKFDAQGNHIWSRSFPQPMKLNVGFDSLSPTSQGGAEGWVLLAGATDFGTGPVSGIKALVAFGP